MTKLGLSPRSLIEKTSDPMRRSDIRQHRRLYLAALHHITATGVEGAA